MLKAKVSKPLLNEEQTAALIGIKPERLRRLGYDRAGPKFLKIGRAHFFREEDIAEWIASRVR